MADRQVKDASGYGEVKSTSPHPVHSPYTSPIPQGSSGGTDIPALLHTHFEGLNTGNVQQLLATFTADAVFSSPAGTVAGIDAIARLFASLPDTPRAMMHLVHARQIHSPQGVQVACHVRRSLELAEGGQVLARHEVDLALTFTITDAGISRCETSLLER